MNRINRIIFICQSKPVIIASGSLSEMQYIKWSHALKNNLEHIFIVQIHYSPDFHCIMGIILKHRNENNVLHQGPWKGVS
jgi:hypothetical protein